MLYVGTNYHPHDWPRERWQTDIEMMNKASFNVVRLGHLCWDCFEPSEGNFTMEWFDQVLEMFTQANIQVVLDIATRPAPVWLHQKFPGINITDRSGIQLHAQTRYMVDFGHPAFQEYAYRFAEKLVTRYKDHPVLLAFGLCNELGAGFISYSEEARTRFIAWLQNKYGTVDALNRAWATQRWSRHLNSFYDVVLPVSGEIKGSPERQLDMWRFYSDETLIYMKGLSQRVRAIAPNIRESTNHWSENPNLGFDYLKEYREIIDIPGTGFYPGINPEDCKAVIGACFVSDHRVGELSHPIWSLEFQTGTFGGYGAPKQAMRMYAYLSLIHRSQMTCAWTWRSMLGGEEQYFFGLLDHDGEPSWKYGEFKQIAEEFKRLEAYGFPRNVEPEVAIAYSYESNKVSGMNPSFYKLDYQDHVLKAYEALFHDNIDCNVVNLRALKNAYKLLIVPGHAVMDAASAATIREYVETGGTVVMTAYSAKVNENNQVFDTPMPGYLSDVFGIRANAFDRAKSHTPTENEGGVTKTALDVQRKHLDITYNGTPLGVEIDYYEILEPKTAAVVATFTNELANEPAVTCNVYGQGQAYYVAVPADERLLKPLLRDIYKEQQIQVGPITPRGVVARQLNDTSWLYVNMTGQPQHIELEAHETVGVLTGKSYSVEMELPAYQVDVIIR